MTSERTPQDVLRELRQRFTATRKMPSLGAFHALAEDAIDALDDSIAEAPDSPLPRAYCGDCDGVGWVEGGPTIKTTCARCGGDGWEPQAPDTLSEKPGLDVERPWAEAAQWGYQYAGALCVAYDFREDDIVPLLDLLSALGNGEVPVVEWPAVVPTNAERAAKEATRLGSTDSEGR